MLSQMRPHSGRGEIQQASLSRASQAARAPPTASAPRAAAWPRRRAGGRYPATQRNVGRAVRMGPLSLPHTVKTRSH